MQADKNEHRKALKANLLALWIYVEGQLDESAKAKAKALIGELDGLLKKGGADFSWVECNKAQLLMVPLLPEAVLEAQFRHLLRDAHVSGMLSTEQHDATIKRLFGEGAKVPPDARRESYRTFLGELHQFHLSRRFRRDMRLATAKALLWFAAGIFVLAAITVVLFAMAPLADAQTQPGKWVWPSQKTLMDDPVFCMGAAAAFGIVGAFFSRLVSFQSRQQTYGFEALMHNFSLRFVAVRCAVGMFGAIVFYLLMRSGLLGGKLFLEEPMAATVRNYTGEFAKLLVWSFIAGWSERLVPETLERTESRAKSESTDKQTSSAGQ